MFHLKISTADSALTKNRADELSRILRVIADRVHDGHTKGTAVDSNGNQVGAWKVTP